MQKTKALIWLFPENIRRVEKQADSYFGGVDAQEIPGVKPEVWLALPSELCRMTLSLVEFLTLAPGKAALSAVPRPLPGFSSVQFSSISQSCPTLCDPIDCSMPSFPVHHQLSELAQTHVHWVNDAIQPSHPLSYPSPAFNLSQHQGIFKWVSSLHQVAKVLEFQLQHQSFQWIFRTDFL